MIIRRLLAYASFYLPRIGIICAERLRINLTTKWKTEYDVVRELPLNQAIYIFVVFPNKYSAENTIEALVTLIKNRVSVLVVVNQNNFSTDFIDLVKHLDIGIIHRKNFGRDFGGYQHGFNYLLERDLLAGIESLFLLNDSCIFPGNFKKFAKRISSVKSEWGCAFLNFEYHLHAQSFFTWYSGEVVRSAAFNNFWNSYKPYSSRRHAIVNGEVGLTDCLVKANYLPEPALNSVELSDILDNCEINVNHLFGIYLSYGEILRESLEDEQTLHSIHFQRCLVEANPSHRIGLLATQYLGIPLKRDIFKAGFATLGGVTDCLQATGLSLEKINNIEKSLTRQGSNNTATRIERLQRQFGLY